MKKLFFLLLAAVIVTGSLQAQKKVLHKQEVAGKETSVNNKNIKYGTASFYADKFNGRRTASGEIYNSLKYTAACNTLPLNTWIKVTNLRNNKRVIVKINDRMHRKNKRLVDLSKVAAKKLGYFGRGLTRVKLEVLNNYVL